MLQFVSEKNLNAEETIGKNSEVAQFFHKKWRPLRRIIIFIASTNANSRHPLDEQSKSLFISSASARHRTTIQKQPQSQKEQSRSDRFKAVSLRQKQLCETCSYKKNNIFLIFKIQI